MLENLYRLLLGFVLITTVLNSDVSECKIGGRCLPICINEKYANTCENNNTSSNIEDPQEHIKCEIKEKRASLLVPDGSKIQNIILENYEMSSIVNMSVGEVRAFDYVFHVDLIFWFDSWDQIIYKAPICENGKRSIAVKSGATMSVKSLAVDWIYEHIYWTSWNKGSIELADFEGRMQKTLIDSGLITPRSIAVDPLRGWMYWSDFKKIERAGLDGTRREVIVTDENNWPTGITLDLASERLYWLGFKMHTISSCNFDGSKRTLILSSRKWISNAYAITMFQDSVYWSNYGQNAIIKANKLDGSSVTSVKNLFSYDMLVYDSNKQPNGTNYCRTNVDVSCSHFCLPAPQINNVLPKTSCACPNSLILLSDGRTCDKEGLPIISSSLNSSSWNASLHKPTNWTCNVKGIPPPNILWFKNGQQLNLSEKGFRLSLRDENQTLFINSTGLEDNGLYMCFAWNKKGSVNSTKTLTIIDKKDDQKYNRLIKTADHSSLIISKGSKIWNISLDKHEMSVIINSTGLVLKSDFSVVKKIIFWFDYLDHRIYRTPIGSNGKHSVVAEGYATTSVNGLAVDWIYGHIYWTNAIKGSIELVNFEGNMRKTLIYSKLIMPRSIAVDPFSGWMFWGDFKKIERAGLDGTNREVIVSSMIGSLRGITLDLATKRLYWIDKSRHTISSCNFNGSKRKLVLHSLEWILNPYPITVYENFVYWSDMERNAIIKADKLTGTNITVVEQLFSFDLLMFNPSRQPKNRNHCNSINRVCSHLCLPAPYFNTTSPKISCACPNDFELLSNGLTCIKKNPDVPNRR